MIHRDCVTSTRTNLVEDYFRGTVPSSSCSDNGAWTDKGLNGGSNGLLRGQKGETWEGGMRYELLYYFASTRAKGIWIRDFYFSYVCVTRM